MRFVDHYRFLKDLCTGKQDEALRSAMLPTQPVISFIRSDVTCVYWNVQR